MNYSIRCSLVAFALGFTLAASAEEFTVKKTKSGVTVNYDGKLYTRKKDRRAAAALMRSKRPSAARPKRPQVSTPNGVS